MNSVVLVIDDNIRVAKLLATILNINGYTSITASNAKNAYELLKTGPLPALILTDYYMPHVNGCEFIESIATYSEYKDIPVILITSSRLETLKLPTTDNFKGLIKKPFNLNTILEAVRKFTSNQNSSFHSYKTYP